MSSPSSAGGELQRVSVSLYEPGHASSVKVAVTSHTVEIISEIVRLLMFRLSYRLGINSWTA